MEGEEKVSGGELQQAIFCQDHGQKGEKPGLRSSFIINNVGKISYFNVIKT